MVEKDPVLEEADKVRRSIPDADTPTLQEEARRRVRAILENPGPHDFQTILQKLGLKDAVSQAMERAFPKTPEMIVPRMNIFAEILKDLGIGPGEWSVTADPTDPPRKTIQIPLLHKIVIISDRGLSSTQVIDTKTGNTRILAWRGIGQWEIDLKKLLTAPIEREARDAGYYGNGGKVCPDLQKFAAVLGKGKTAADLTNLNIRTLSIVCQSGETVNGEKYLFDAGKALGMTDNIRDFRSKRKAVLGALFEIAGIETEAPDTWHSMGKKYFRDPATIRRDLVAFADQAKTDRGEPDKLTPSSMKNIRITCANGESLTGQTYLNRAVCACHKGETAKTAWKKWDEVLARMIGTAQS